MLKNFPGTQFAYAVGRLILWSTNENLVDQGGAVLKNNRLKYIAIANA